MGVIADIVCQNFANVFDSVNHRIISFCIVFPYKLWALNMSLGMDI